MIKIWVQFWIFDSTKYISMGIFYIIKITPLSGMAIVSFIVSRACSNTYKKCWSRPLR